MNKWSLGGKDLRSSVWSFGLEYYEMIKCA